MTLLEINLTDVLSETDPDDRVIVWAPVIREGPAGQLVGPRRKTIPLTDGVGSDEVVPGPLMVQVQCKAMSDTRPREVVVPEEGPVTLTALFDSSGAFTYSPAVVGQVAQMRDDAEAARDAAMAAAGSATAGAEQAVSDAVVGLDLMERTTAEGLIDAGKWWRPRLTTGDTIEDKRGLANVGLFPVGSTVVGLPWATPGWVAVTHDPGASRTRQVFTPSSPTDQRNVARTYSGGAWTEWRPEAWHGLVLTSADHADNLTIPHAYAVNSSSVGGLPVASVGTLEVLPAGSGFSTTTQRFTPRPLTDGVWIRSLTSGTWTAWTLVPSLSTVESLIPDGQGGGTRPVPEPITYSPTETPTSGGSVIVQSLSLDRRVGFNALTSVLRQTMDEGATWVDVRSFAGMNIEWCRSLPDGEVMVETTSTVEGVSGVRRIWVSAGYDQYNPTAATWEVTLTAAAPLVKFADWSISITDEMILLAEYGPKQGVVWGSGTEPIGEGLNARYIYRSYDNGRTWDTIFDLNTFLLDGGRTTADGQHLHGVAWDPYWDRIWVSFGDSTGGTGSNGVIYSDDEGQSWHAAYWTHIHPSQGWQVVGIQPMKDAVLFAGDMTPSGVMRLDRAQGKHPDTFEFEAGWDYSDVEKHLCQQIIHHDSGRSESAIFAFSREGSTSPSFIVATHTGWDWYLLWVSADNPMPGIRTIAGPTRAGNLIAAVNSSAGWRQVAGPIDTY